MHREREGNMIALNEQADLQPLSQVDRLLQLICGNPREFPVQDQVLNWLCVTMATWSTMSGVENTTLGITPVWPSFLASIVLLSLYYVSRVKRKFVRQMRGVALVFGLVGIIVPWFTNNGLLGSAPAWMFIGITYLSIFQRSWVRILAAGLFLLEFVALSAIQIANPSTVVPYPSTMVAYIDIGFTVITIALYLSGYVLVLSYNLEKRQQQAEGLLLNILPKRIAEQLEYSPNKNVAEHVQNASVLFADVVSFTPMTADMAASDLIGLLNEVFSAFDNLVEQRGLEKIKTIGDCYMVAAGVPESRDDHACVLADLALAMQQYVTGRMFKGKELSFRIGINSGPLVAGVIGRKKFIYDLWGDTVNTASRMESHGVAGRVQVTESTRGLIEREFCVEPRGTIPIKGKGEMPVWFVTGRKADVSF